MAFEGKACAKFCLWTRYLKEHDEAAEPILSRLLTLLINQEKGKARRIQKSRKNYLKNSFRSRFRFGDGSFTNGVLASDTLTFDSTDRRSVKIPNIAIGCGHNNGGFDSATDGTVGLANGAASLISQLGDSIDGKFSYCFVPLQDNASTSILNFGSNAVVSGKGVQSTHLRTSSEETFYYLSLKNITVGNSSKGIPVDPSPLRGPANIILDTGTTLTFLPPSVIKELETQVKAAVSAPSVDDPSHQFGTCFSAQQSDTVFPDITFHFSGAAIKLPPKNMFFQVADGVVCLAAAADPSTSVYGTLAQMDFHVGYDIAGYQVSFLPTKCATA